MWLMDEAEKIGLERTPLDLATRIYFLSFASEDIAVVSRSCSCICLLIHFIPHIQSNPTGSDKRTPHNCIPTRGCVPQPSPGRDRACSCTRWWVDEECGGEDVYAR